MIYGFLHGNQIKIFVAESKDDIKFKKAVTDYLEKIKQNYLRKFSSLNYLHPLRNPINNIDIHLDELNSWH